MILSFDVGTTGNKAALVDPATGQVVASVTAPYPTRYTPDGGAEQNPDDWWQSVAAACRELTAQHPTEMANLDAIGCSGMMNGVVLIDPAGVPCRSSILHADTRSAPQCRALETNLGRDALFQATANRPDPHLTLPKMLWLAQNEPDIVARAAFVVQAKDYVIGKLTGVWGVTDPSDASLTGAFRVADRRWARDIWEAVGLESSLLPQVVPSTQVVGHVTREAAEWAGLTSGIPVVMGGGDGACATAGSGVGHGAAYNVLGGTSWVGLRMEAPLYDDRLSNYCSLDDTVTVFGTVQSAGSALEWFASLFGASSHSELDAEATLTPPGAHHLFFLPYLQGERAPLWDSDARGVYFGLATHHTRADLYRATLEGVGYALRSILDVFAENGHPLDSVRLLGGGANSPLWREILTNIFNRETQIVGNVSAATSLGAALAAGVGVGLFPDWPTALSLARIVQSFPPDPSLAAGYAPRYAFSQTLYPALKDRFAALALLEN